MTIERRFFKVEVETRDAGKDKDYVTLKGLASPFGKESVFMGFKEIVRKGAFTDALNGSDVLALFNHDDNYVLGRESSGTLRLRESEDGLEAEIDAPKSGMLHDMVVAPVKRGDIKGMSIGFIVATDEIKSDDDGVVTRTITKIDRLFDVSVVTNPAYPDTNVSVRSVEEYRNKLHASAGCPLTDQSHECGEAGRPLTNLSLHERREIRLKFKKTIMRHT